MHIHLGGVQVSGEILPKAGEELRLHVTAAKRLKNNQLVWRREWDSNPRYGKPYT
jgi:hypothetical protein